MSVVTPQPGFLNAADLTLDLTTQWYKKTGRVGLALLKDVRKKKKEAVATHKTVFFCFVAFVTLNVKTINKRCIFFNSLHFIFCIHLITVF